MTKGELVELVLLGFTGGKLSADSNIKRDEIRVYLPAALSAALRDAIFEQRGQARADLAAGLLFDLDLDPNYYTPFTATPTYDTVRKVYYIDLPKLADLPYGWATRVAYSQVNPMMPFVKMRSATAFAGADNLIGSVTGFWVDHTETPRMNFVGYQLPVCPVIAEIAKDASVLEDSDLLPYPGHVINRAIMQCERKFNIQCSRPADNLSDNKDVNEHDQ